MTQILNQDLCDKAVADRPIDEKTTFGLIAINDNTRNHGATLQSLGYNVKEVQGHVAVQGKFLRAGKTDVIDISTRPRAKGFFTAVANNKRLLNYNQKFLMPGQSQGDKPWFGNPALPMLQSDGLVTLLGFNPTCLIAKKGKIQPVRVTPVDPFALPSDQPEEASQPTNNDPFTGGTLYLPAGRKKKSKKSDPFATDGAKSDPNDPFAA